MSGRRYTYHVIIVVAVILFTFYFYATQINKPLFALEVDPTKDTTDISGVMYRIRLTNIGMKQLSGIVVTLGNNDIQNLTYLDPDQSYFFLSKARHSSQHCKSHDQPRHTHSK